MHSTLEVLGAIKYPPVVIAKQANIAHNQQVNSGAVFARARKSENQQTQLKPYSERQQSASGQTPVNDWLRLHFRRSAK